MTYDVLYPTAHIDTLTAEIIRLGTILDYKEKLAHRLAAECVERLRDQGRLREALDEERAIVDGLYADNNRLRTELSDKTEGYERTWSALQAETATSVRVRGQLRDENVRLREALQRIESYGVWELDEAAAYGMQQIAAQALAEK